MILLTSCLGVSRYQNTWRKEYTKFSSRPKGSKWPVYYGWVSFPTVLSFHSISSVWEGTLYELSEVFSRYWCFFALLRRYGPVICFLVGTSFLYKMSHKKTVGSYFKYLETSVWLYENITENTLAR